MASFLQHDRVQYVVSPSFQAPLSRLYFCRHCLKIRSTYCVLTEVDSHYCPNCLENMPSAEAKLKRNKCTNCFDCPSCCHTLSTRATTVPVPSTEDPTRTVPKKVYYLACGFCRWTSRDVGMQDQVAASGGWTEQEIKDASRIQSLMDYYRQLSRLEKVDKDNKKMTRRRSYLQFSDKYGFSSVAARRKSGLSSIGGLSLKDNEDLKLQDLPLVEKIEKFDSLPESFYKEPVNLELSTNITQRLMSPEFQPETTKDLYPRRKDLLVKKSARCKECEHNLIKLEFNPASIKFKLQLIAIDHVPEIRIMSEPQLYVNKETQVILTLLNPNDILTHVFLSECPKDEDNWSNTQVILPQSELTLARRDDIAEFDNSHDSNQDFKDDPGIIAFRKLNKIGFFVKVTPTCDSKNIKISFRMKYNYKNVVQMNQSKEAEIVWLQQTVCLNLGQTI